MTQGKVQITLLKILILLELINFQIITVLAQDLLPFKYFRDMILVLLIISVLISIKKIPVDMTVFMVLAVCLFLLLAMAHTNSMGVSLVFIRRYLFPIAVLFCVLYSEWFDHKAYASVMRFNLNLLFVMAIWGIFQAHVLGEAFLIKIGYPTMYSAAYGREALVNSYYFGDLGIQRVVSTISNPNVLALILGISLLILFFDHQTLLIKKGDKIKFVVVLLAFGLTFSRANILALIVAGIFLWKFIPRKKILAGALVVLFVSFVIVYFVQGADGIPHKLVGWVIDSFTFKESSATYRAFIWADAIESVKANPFGIGYGKVGSYALTSGMEVFHHSENSFLAIALDLGIFGLVVYLAFIFSVVLRGFKRTNCNKKYGWLSVAIVIYMFIAFMFSNHIYDMEAICYIFCVLGFLVKDNGKSREDISYSLHI